MPKQTAADLVDFKVSRDSDESRPSYHSGSVAFSWMKSQATYEWGEDF